MRSVFSSMRSGAWAATGLLTATLLFSACKKFNNKDNSDVPVSGLMAFNLAPDVSQAKIAVSGSSLTQAPIPYNNFTGNYLGVYSGTTQVQSINSNTGMEIASNSFAFEKDKFYSTFLVGTNNNYRNVVVHDNVDSLSTTTGEAFIRYINAIPDSSHPAVSIAVNGSNVVNDNAAFASVSEFKPLAAGAVTITVTNGGTINKNRTITLDQLKVYTVLLSGVPGSTNADSLQIKYIVNGTVDASAAKVASVGARAAN